MGGRDSKFIIFAIIMILSLSSSVFSWEKTYGQVAANSVVQSADGGYAVTGYIHGSSDDVVLLKTDSAGNFQWSKSFGGGSSDIGYSVLQTTDLGYIIAGTTGSFNATNDIYVIKTDAAGDCVWTRTYGGLGSDSGSSIYPAQDGGYIIGGTTTTLMPGPCAFNNLFMCMLKIDSTGSQQWMKAVGVCDKDATGQGAVQAMGGGYVIGGNNITDMDFYLAKTDSSGNQLWQKNYGAGGFVLEQGRFLNGVNDGGFIMTGDSPWNGGDICVLKTDASGDCVWARSYGGNEPNSGMYIMQTADNGFIVTGHSDNVIGVSSGSDVFVLKIDASGNQDWMKNFGGSGYDIGYSVKQTTDGGYIVAGYTNSPEKAPGGMYLIKLDENGNNEPFPTPTQTFTEPPTVTFSPTITITGTNTATFTATPTYTCTPTITPTLPSFCMEAAGIYPNPAEESADIIYNLCRSSEIQVTIYSVSGEIIRRIRQAGWHPGNNTCLWDCRNGRNKGVASGTYLYCIEAVSGGEKTKVWGKLAVIK